MNTRRFFHIRRTAGLLLALILMYGIFLPACADKQSVSAEGTTIDNNNNTVVVVINQETTAPSDTSGEKPAEKPPEKPPEKTPEKPPEKPPEKTPEKPPVKPPEKPKPHKSSNTGVQTSYVVPFSASAARSLVNVRLGASTKADLLARLAAGEIVTVIGQTTGADNKVWYRILYGSVIGYIRHDLVDVLCGTALLGGPTDPVPRCIGQTNMRAVNVRLEMSTSSARVRLLRRGQTVTILGRAYDIYGTPWYYVVIPTGAIGYIRGDLVNVIAGFVVEAPMPQPIIASPWGAYGNVYGYGYVDPSLYDDTGYETAEEELEQPQSDGSEELIYLRYMNIHMADYASIGSGYRGYSLYDLDGDGVNEALVDCGNTSTFVWQIYSCDGETVIDLGQLKADGYYLAREGEGMLLVSVLSDTETCYAKMEKVGNSMVPMYTLIRTADASWHYTWTYNQKPITTSSLLQLLSGFTDDVIQNMGLYQEKNQGITPAEKDNGVIPLDENASNG